MASDTMMEAAGPAQIAAWQTSKDEARAERSAVKAEIAHLEAGLKVMEMGLGKRKAQVMHLATELSKSTTAENAALHIMGILKMCDAASPHSALGFANGIVQHNQRIKQLKEQKSALRAKISDIELQMEVGVVKKVRMRRRVPLANSATSSARLSQSFLLTLPSQDMAEKHEEKHDDAAPTSPWLTAVEEHMTALRSAPTFPIGKGYPAPTFSIGVAPSTSAPKQRKPRTTKQMRIDAERKQREMYESLLTTCAKLIGDELDAELDKHKESVFLGMIETFISWTQERQIEFLASIDMTSTTNFLAYLIEVKRFSRCITAEMVTYFASRANDSIEEERLWTLILGGQDVSDIMHLFSNPAKASYAMWKGADGRVQIRVHGDERRYVDKLAFFDIKSATRIEDRVEQKNVWLSYVANYQSMLTGGNHARGKTPKKMKA